MKLTEGIREFVVGVAHYHVVSKDGNAAVLRIDYKNNTYDLEAQGEQLDWEFQQEVSRVAEDLLQRKHGVNFAQPVK